MDLKGRISLVNIWATWCAGCRTEHPFLNALAKRGEVPIYAINWRDNLVDARRWLQSYGDPMLLPDSMKTVGWGLIGVYTVRRRPSCWMQAEWWCIASPDR